MAEGESKVIGGIGGMRDVQEQKAHVGVKPSDVKVKQVPGRGDSLIAWRRSGKFKEEKK